MTQTAVITVMIADQNDILRRGIAHVVDSYPSLQLVGQAARPSETLRLCQTLHPDILLIEPAGRDDKGIETIRTIRRDCPTTRIIALSDAYDEQHVQAAIQAGVTSYLLKHVSPNDLVNAIYDATIGKSTLAREAAQALVNAAQRPSTSRFHLTRRELEVLELIAEGLSNREIAERLSLSVGTVKVHTRNIYGKLDVNSRTQAVAQAAKLDLL